MDRVTHVIDPDGEVIIVLQNPNAPFAELSEALTSDKFTYLLPGPSDEIQNFGWCAVHNLSEPAQPPFEEPALEWPVTEEPAAEPAEPTAEPVEETVAEPAEPTKPTAESAEEPVAEPVAEPTAEPVEETVAESAEEPVAEPAEPAKPAAESAEEPVEEEPAELGLTKQPEENCFRIQVSAKHLILASSVFKKILTGGWKESITYLQKGSVEITADGWDLNALLIMLRIIHCQSYQIPGKLTLEMLAKVAVLADYYDCREAIGFLANTWINNLDESIPMTYGSDLMLWVWVSWFFQLPAQFKQATSTVMSLSSNWIDSMGLPIPNKVIGSMNSHRQGAIASVVNRLDKARDGLLSGTRGCSFECRSIMYGALTLQMQSNALLAPIPIAPYPNLNYRKLVQEVLSFTPPQWYGLKARQAHKCPHSCFESLIDTLNDTIEGLGLDNLVRE